MALPLKKAVPVPAKTRSKFVHIGDVKNWTENPWKHEAVVPRLAELIAINGQVSPVVVWTLNNTIYKGNHTKKALMYLGENLAKVAKAIGDTEENILKRVEPTKIKVEWIDFPSDAAAVAYGMADNNSSMGGEYDDDLLRKLLKSDEGYFTTQRTGFTEKDMKAFALSGNSDRGRLDNIDLQGGGAALGSFLVLQFEDEGEMAEFREMVGMGKQERAFLFSDLRNYLK